MPANISQAIEAIDSHQRVDRILELKIIDDKAPLSSTGLVDRRLFKGENKLHAVTDPYTGLWSLNYEKGECPPAFKCQFTSFKKLYQFATDYFLKRNIEIKEIVD